MGLADLCTGESRHDVRAMPGRLRARANCALSHGAFGLGSYICHSVPLGSLLRKADASGTDSVATQLRCRC